MFWRLFSPSVAKRHQQMVIISSDEIYHRNYPNDFKNHTMHNTFPQQSDFKFCVVVSSNGESNVSKKRVTFLKLYCMIHLKNGYRFTLRVH